MAELQVVQFAEQLAQVLPETKKEAAQVVQAGVAVQTVQDAWIVEQAGHRFELLR